MLKRIKDLGEEQLTRLATTLMSNERFVETIQGVVGGALKTREQMEVVARFALSSLNIPTAGDIERLEQKVLELEELIDLMSEQVELLERVVPASRGED